ncbi:MAG: hypothetical protein M1818_007352 [Claussenomyces sp. TS43310]|nr:MAG: hypothetical protein M1818_007352 [Claussenomyces sp. TS43310]
MGNAQSGEEPRREPKRLSKARSTASPAQSAQTARANLTESSSIANQQSSTSTPPSRSLVAEGIPSQTMPDEVKQRRRMSIFRSKSRQRPSLVERRSEPGHVPSEHANASLQQRDSRAGSVDHEALGKSHGLHHVIRPTARPARHSLSYLPFSKQSSRLSLVVEVKTPEPDLDVRARWPNYTGETDEPYTRHLSAPPTQRTNSDASANFPIRRRSLLTPGIATRGNSAEDVSQRSSFTQHSSSPIYEDTQPISNTELFFDLQVAQAMSSDDRVQQFYNKRRKSALSPPEDLASLHEPERVQSRTVTPSDLDYRHLGSYKLGSLRITNGTASPPLSVHELDCTDTKAATSAMKGDHIPEIKSAVYGQYDPNASKHAEFGWEMEDDDQLASVNDYHDIPTERELVWFHRSADSMEGESHRADSHGEEFKELAAVTSRSEDQSLRLLEHDPVSSYKFNPQSPTRASELAQEYMSEIASSPFSFDDSPPPSPNFQATSKHTALEDHLFDDEAESNISLSFQPQGMIGEREAQGSDDNRPDASDARERERRQSPKVLVKKEPANGDSLYSSKISHLSSNHISTDAKALDLPMVPDRLIAPTLPKISYSRNSYGMAPTPKIPPRSHSRTRSEGGQVPQPGEIYMQDLHEMPVPAHLFQPPQAQMAMSHRSQGDALLQTHPSKTPAVPMDFLSALNPGQSNVMSSTYDETTNEPWEAAEADPHLQTKPTLLRPNRRPSVPIPRDSTSSLPLSTVNSDASTSSSKRRLRKKDQRDSYSPHLVTVQCCREIESEHIPVVSSEAFAKLEERLKTLPPLTHTYRDVHRTHAKEQLTTVFPLASAGNSTEDMSRFERYEGPLLTASANEEIGHEVPGESISRDTLLPSTPFQSTDQRPYARGWNRSSKRLVKGFDMPREHQSQRQSEPHITDFGTVAESLRGSPYDITLNTTNRRRSDSPSSTVAGDMNDDRGKLQRMDSFSASQFARERSQRRRSRSRRQSYDNKLNFDDRGGIPGRSPRPWSMVEDIPPLPKFPPDDIKPPSLPKKVKSPPPVSMATRHKAPAVPLQESTRAVLVRASQQQSNPEENTSKTSFEENVELKPQNPEDPWQKQRQLWAERKATASGTLQQNPSRRSIDNARMTAAKPISESTKENGIQQQPCWQSFSSERHHTVEAERPSDVTFSVGPQAIDTQKFVVRLSPENQPSRQSSQGPPQQYRTSPIKQQEFNRNQDVKFRDSSDSLGHHGAPQAMIPQRSFGTLPYVSNTSSAAPYPSPTLRSSSSPPTKVNPYEAIKLNSSLLSTQLPLSSSSTDLGKECLTFDRYNGGLAYGYEPGYGLGGSAGMRNSVSTASRKGIDASLRYGVDFSDIPIMVRLERREGSVEV